MGEGVRGAYVSGPSDWKRAKNARSSPVSTDQSAGSVPAGGSAGTPDVAGEDGAPSGRGVTVVACFSAGSAAPPVRSGLAG